MKRSWQLLVLGLGAYLLFALVSFPAGLALSWFAPENLAAYGVSGTLWRGRAEVVIVDDAHLGGVQWSLHVLPLFTAKLVADFELTRVDGHARGRLSASPGGRLRFENLDGSLPLSALPGGIIPPGWTGTLRLNLAQLTIEDAWPTGAEGTVDALAVTGPPGRPTNLGNYRISFPAQPSSQQSLTGALTDIGGPLQVTGTLQLKEDRSYVIDGLIATRPDAPAGVASTLQYLGPADAQGRRPFSLAGSL